MLRIIHGHEMYVSFKRRKTSLNLVRFGFREKRIRRSHVFKRELPSFQFHLQKGKKRVYIIGK